MKRDIIAVICLIIVATLVFVSCGNKNKIFKDIEGKTHVALTDENGEMVTDDYGDVYVVPTDENKDPVTDENGDIVTQVAKNQKVFTEKDGRHIDTIAYSLDVPDGWEVYDGGDYASLKSTDIDNSATINLIYYSCSHEEALQRIKDFRDALEGSTKEEKEYTEEDVDLHNDKISEATKIKLVSDLVSGSGEEYTLCVRSYVFTVGNRSFGISCLAENEKDLATADLESIISAMVFK